MAFIPSSPWHSIRHHSPRWLRWRGACGGACGRDDQCRGRGEARLPPPVRRAARARASARTRLPPPARLWARGRVRGRGCGATGRGCEPARRGCGPAWLPPQPARRGCGQRDEGATGCERQRPPDEVLSAPLSNTFRLSRLCSQLQPGAKYNKEMLCGMRHAHGRFRNLSIRILSLPPEASN